MVRPSQRRATEKYKKKHYRTVIGYIRRETEEFKWLEDCIDKGISINSVINRCLRLGAQQAGWVDKEDENDGNG